MTYYDNPFSYILDFLENAQDYIELLLITYICITIIAIMLIWTFIRSAVKSGTKEAIMECYDKIQRIEAESEEVHYVYTTIEEDIEEDLKN